MPADPSDTETSDAIFIALRPTLLGLAYRMLGTVGDAEDVVQDAWMRWREQVSREAVTSPAAFLRTVTARLSIDRYRAERRRRSSYPGPWLPEPVATDAGPFQVLESQRLTSCALLWALETLTPLERAAFILAEAFDYRPGDIAAVIGRTETNCRQLLHRARRRLADATPAPDRGQHPGSASGRLLDELLVALARADTRTAERLLASDVHFIGDGGGQAPAVSRPVHGRRSVLRLLMGLALRAPDPVHALEVREVNGEAGLVLMGSDGPETVLMLAHDGRRITGLFAQRNPRKLERLERSPRRSATVSGGGSEIPPGGPQKPSSRNGSSMAPSRTR